ncbi:Fic family protein [Roseateles sp. So40a]|uniref:Fic family protein n=1 Tax=Roseateles sp. So40a TaxID=3400226 RepID=UPI003A8ADC86
MNAKSERPLDRLDPLRPDPQGLMKAPWCVREPDSTYLATRPKPPDWSERSLQMFDFMQIPVDFRDKVPYRREFLDAYQPNVDSLLPPALAESLYRTAHWENGPHHFDGAVMMMTEFLTEFCWASSKLEGCTFSLAETDALFRLDEALLTEAAQQDKPTRIVVNHKRAIEFMASHGYTRRTSYGFIRQLHAYLVDGLLPPDRCGRVRELGVTVTGTAYVPHGIHALLEEMLQQIATKAAAIRNPVESAFFLWIHIAYLQAFADGNKRTGRVAANLPLLSGHCAPLSFAGVEKHDYVVAMLGVYERNDVAVAVDLFEWLYRRSMQKYLWMLG